MRRTLRRPRHANYPSLPPALRWPPAVPSPLLPFPCLSQSHLAMACPALQAPKARQPTSTSLSFTPYPLSIIPALPPCTHFAAGVSGAPCAARCPTRASMEKAPCAMLCTCVGGGVGGVEACGSSPCQDTVPQDNGCVACSVRQRLPNTSPQSSYFPRPVPDPHPGPAASPPVRPTPRPPTSLLPRLPKLHLPSSPYTPPHPVPPPLPLPPTPILLLPSHTSSLFPSPTHPTRPLGRPLTHILVQLLLGLCVRLLAHPVPVDRQPLVGPRVIAQQATPASSSGPGAGN